MHAFSSLPLYYILVLFVRGWLFMWTNKRSLIIQSTIQMQSSNSELVCHWLSHTCICNNGKGRMTSIIDPSGPGANGKPPKKAQRTQRNGWHIRVIQYLFPVLGSIIVAAAHTRPFPGLIDPPTRGEIRQTRTCKLIWQQPEAEEVFSLVGRRRQTHPELYRHHHVHQWHNEKAAACTKHIGLCPEPNKL